MVIFTMYPPHTIIWSLYTTDMCPLLRLVLECTCIKSTPFCAIMAHMNRNDTEILYTDKYTAKETARFLTLTQNYLSSTEIQITNSPVTKNHMLVNLIFGRFQELNSISAIYIRLWQLERTVIRGIDNCLLCVLWFVSFLTSFSE